MLWDVQASDAAESDHDVEVDMTASEEVPAFNLEENDSDVELLEGAATPSSSDPSTLSTVGQFLEPEPFARQPLQLTHPSEQSYSEANRRKAKPALSWMNRREREFRKELMKPKAKSAPKTDAVGKDDAECAMQMKDFKKVRITANNTSQSTDKLVCISLSQLSLTSLCFARC